MPVFYILFHQLGCPQPKAAKNLPFLNFVDTPPLAHTGVTDLRLTEGYGPAETLEQSWIYQSGLDQLNDGSRYFKSRISTLWSLQIVFFRFLQSRPKALFKSMSHMLSIGYGCYTPTIIEDMWATVVVLFIGCCIFALFLSQMIALIDQINMSEKIFKRHLQEVWYFRSRSQTKIATNKEEYGVSRLKFRLMIICDSIERQSSWNVQ